MYLVQILISFGFSMVASPSVSTPLKEASIAYQSGDYAGALKHWQVGADLGISTSQYNLAILYENGLGVDRNDLKAFHWYSRAADNGLAMAQLWMGLQAYNETTKKYEPASEISWLEKAAEQKNPRAMFRLGSVYAIGNGRPINTQKALELYDEADNLSCLQGLSSDAFVPILMER